MRIQRRRLLLALAAILATPSAAQRAKLPRIGVLTFESGPAEIKEAFRAGLRDHGYFEGKNILIEWRSAEGRIDRANAAAAELVRLKVDIILAATTPAVQAAKSATSTIPIVMAPAGDPIGTGFVQSLARPGGNITGVTTMAADLGAKLLGTIKEVRPALRHVAVLVDTNPFARGFLEQVQAGAGKIGVRISSFVVQQAGDLESRFAAMAKERVDAVILQPQWATQQAAGLATKHRIPSITTGIGSAYPDLGGLMYYGASGVELHRRAAVYVDKILKGAKPADLPVELPTKIELVLNLKAAKAIGVSIPQPVVLRADRVIR